MKKENAERYFNGSKGEALKILKKLYETGLIDFPNMPNQEIPLKLKADLKTFNMPRWDELAKDVKLSDLHALIYPLLSGISHGNMLSLGERILENKKISSLADINNIAPFIPIANNLFRDCYFLCLEWIVHGKLQPAPDIKKLITHE